MPRKGFTPILILLVIALLGAGVFLVLQNYEIRPKSFSKPVAASPTPTPTPDPTASWKMYSDPNNGFSFKYPEDYFHYLLQSDTGVYLAPSQGDGGSGPKFLGKDEVWLDVGLDLSIGSPTAQKTPVSIGGLSGFKYISESPAVAGNVTVYYLKGEVTKDNINYGIAMSAWDQSTLKKNEGLFDQILSTFKFIEPTPTNSPS